MYAYLEGHKVREDGELVKEGARGKGVGQKG